MRRHQAIATAVVAHYAPVQRDLPWRRTRDPYAIWVSEIMLQQTRVATVIPYWERWMTRFPTVSALTDAPLDDVLAAWAGLGYYSRARNLHAGARAVDAQFGGALPSCAAELREVPGIGPYTAGAIAFGERAPPVDGNVARVLAAYVAFCSHSGRGAQSTLANLLDRSWSALLGHAMPLEELRTALATCMALIPGEDDEPWVDSQIYAENAASAIAYTLKTLDGGAAQDATWAARTAYEALDSFVINKLGIENEAQILAHPVVQAEFARQLRDLDELRVASPAPAAMIVRLRARAREEATIFFGPNR